MVGIESVLDKPIDDGSGLRWRSASIYQIYPRSFLEVRQPGEAHRGEGTLLGITSGLEYVRDLGVSAIWISPFYPSPMVDGGYDISDYCGVDPRFGTLTDFDGVVAEAQRLGLKVMVDLVINHTSDQHVWFKESRQSRDNPKSDWYIWRDAGPDGGPPNNWASVFSRSQLLKRQKGELAVPAGANTPPISAWTFDQQRGQYYLHSFAAQQPDLNWQNEEVRVALKEVMRFWLDRGVDGFRMDAVMFIAKDPKFRDEPPNPDYIEGVGNPYYQLQQKYSASYESVLTPYLQELTAVLHEKAYVERDTWITFEGDPRPGIIGQLNSVDLDHANAFNFTRMHAEWRASKQRELLRAYYATLPAGATPSHVNGNHDMPRVATRLGEPQARAAAVVNALLSGQMYIYYGEEIGMLDGEIGAQDGDDQLGMRDGCRTPMQWSGQKNAGFSLADESNLWLPLSVGWHERTVETESSDPLSWLSLYKQLLRWRREPVFASGELELLGATHDEVVSFKRAEPNQACIVVVNFSDQEAWSVEVSAGEGRIILSSLDVESRRGEEVNLMALRLMPFEALVIWQGVD